MNDMHKMKTRHNSLVWIFLALAFFVQFAQAQPQVQSIADIYIRDPYILPDTKTGTYYMYRSASTKNDKGELMGGVEAFKSKDLVNWEGPLRVFTVPEGIGSLETYGHPRFTSITGNIIFSQP